MHMLALSADIVYSAADAPTANPLPDLAMWSALVGVLLPPLVAIVNQPRWPGWARAVITAAACIAAGGITAYLDGSLTGVRWLSAALIVAVAAVGSYQKFWRPSHIAPRIEAATSSAAPDTPPRPAHRA